MGERDTHEHGTFSWTDLSTPDVEASKAFYGGLFGWEFEDNPIPDSGVYVMARLGGRAVAAMFETSERHPAWASYVTVDDVDAITRRARARGDAGRRRARSERDGRAVRRDGRRANGDAPGPDRCRLLRLGAAQGH